MWKFVCRSLLACLLMLMLCVIAGLIIFVYFASDPTLPNIAGIDKYQPKVITRVLASDGQLIGELYEERRTVVPREHIPRIVINAFVDAEDADFFIHRGLNYTGMLRAIAQTLNEGQQLRGASTITQQLVKTYLIKSNKRTIRRKIQEMYLALRLERRYDKEIILWLYVNQIYFGHGRFGVEEAARFYFGKSVRDVNAGEAALLASLPKGPEEISPRKHPERAKDRQRYVLSQMARYRHITREEAQKFAEEPIRLIKEPPPLSNLAPEFVDETEKMLIEKYTADRLPYLGLNVRTTCNLQVQRAARGALEMGLQRLDERNGYRGRLYRLAGAPLVAHLSQLKNAYPSGPAIGSLVDGVITKVLDGGENNQVGEATVDLGAATGSLTLPMVGDRYNPKSLLPSQRFAPGDVVHVRVARLGREGAILTLEQGPQGAALVIDPESRQVLAMVGGYGQSRGNFNRALYAKRQPGSTFKAFLYATAFESKKYTTASLLSVAPHICWLPGQAPWVAKNTSSHNRQFTKPVRLRVALAQSLNTVASRLISDLGVESVIATARLLGIESDLESNCSLALGTSVVSLIELTNSYATLAARGRYGQPFWILQINDGQLARSELSPRISPELAFVTSSALQSVIEEGTAAAIKGKLRRPAAGKTGSTGQPGFLKDALFVGYTPDMVASIWVGFDREQRPGTRVLAADVAVPIWLEVMQAALYDRRIVPFDQPSGIIVQRISPLTGKLARRSRQAINEVFLSGTSPGTSDLQSGESDPNNFPMQ